MLIARPPAVLRAGAGAAQRISDRLARSLSVLLDPRSRMLRKRRRALRWGLFFAAMCAFWFLITALLAVWPTPAWVLLVTGAISAGAASPATLLLLRYRWLRSGPLPAPRPGVTRILPPPDSAARPAMVTLNAAERGLFSLLSVLERGRVLPSVEVAELTGAADRSAAAMAVTADVVVSMEHTARTVPESRAHLQPAIAAYTAHLRAGVGQYGEMVAAAARLMGSVRAGRDAVREATGSISPSTRGFRHELSDATDRLTGWGQAFDELSVYGRVSAV